MRNKIRKERKQKIRKVRKEDHLVKFYLGEKYIPANWFNEVRTHCSQRISNRYLNSK